MIMCILTGSDSSESDGPPVQFLAKERKKKKKKLKSRRERNKRKAILKLSHYSKTTHPHHTPANQQPGLTPNPSGLFPPPLAALSPEEKKSNPNSGISERAPLNSSLSEAPKNNGIPIFIQERLDERQKRRGDTESTERLYTEVNTYVCMYICKLWAGFQIWPSLI